MCNWNANTSENIAEYKELVSLLYQTYDLIIISQIQDLTKNIEPIDTFTFLKYIKVAIFKVRALLFNQFFVRQFCLM